MSGDPEYDADRAAIQHANDEAFRDFMKAVIDGLLGGHSSESLTDSAMLTLHVRNVADRILVKMDERGIGLHRHGRPPKGRTP